MLKVSGILLAAGASSRFGGDKLSAELTGGSTVIAAAAQSLIDVTTHSVAIVAPEQSRRAHLLKPLAIDIIRFSGAERGIGASIGYGIECCRDSDAWIIALADMPYIRPQTIHAVYRQLQMGAQLTAPYSGGRRGHPVGFGKTLQAELQALNEDCGAQSIIEKHQDQMIAVASTDIGIFRDIDRPEDLSC